MSIFWMRSLAAHSGLLPTTTTTDDDDEATRVLQSVSTTMNTRIHFYICIYIYTYIVAARTCYSYIWQGSSTSLPAVTKVDGLPPAPSLKP